MKLLALALRAADDAHADAGADVQMMRVDDIGLFQLGDEPLGHLQRGAFAGLPVDKIAPGNDELVPPKARDNTIIGNLLKQARYDALQELIADIVAQRVVDGLEVVQVDEQKIGELAAFVQRIHPFLQVFDEILPVMQTREGVVRGLVVGLHQQLVLLLAA